MSLLNIVPYIRYSVYRQCPSYGWGIRTRTIPDNEFVLITEGRGVVQIEGKKYKARPGMLFYFYPGLSHALESSDKNPMCFYALHFSFACAKYLNSLWNLEDKYGKLPLNHVMEIKNHIMLEEIMKNINEHWSDNKNDHELICNGLFLQLLHYIYEDIKLGSINYSSRRKVEEAIKYIKENIGNKLSVGMVAGKVNLSSDYFAKIFKSHTGYTPIGFINKCRIDEAKEMLAKENKKIKEIAGVLGFCDEFYFSRVYKRIEGISPMQFYEKTRTVIDQ